MLDEDDDKNDAVRASCGVGVTRVVDGRVGVDAVRFANLDEDDDPSLPLLFTFYLWR